MCVGISLGHASVEHCGQFLDPEDEKHPRPAITAMQSSINLLATLFETQLLL